VLAQGMLFTVDFNDQVLSRAEKIDDVGSDGLLTAKLDAEATVTKFAPEAEFRIGHGAAHLLGKCPVLRRQRAVRQDPLPEFSSRCSPNFDFPSRGEVTRRGWPPLSRCLSRLARGFRRQPLPLDVADAVDRDFVKRDRRQSEADLADRIGRRQHRRHDEGDDDRPFPLRLQRVGGHQAGAAEKGQDDGELEHQTWRRIRDVINPKASGALHLDRLTRAYDLDHFIMYSSASAVLGSGGQSGYTAANAVLDSLAFSRAEAGLPALSVNWGAWEQVGMAAGLGDAHKRRLSERGLGTITPERGLAALGVALGMDIPQIVIMPMRWEALARQFEATQTPPLLRDLIAGATPASSAPAASIARLLADQPVERHPALIQDYLCGVVASVLGLKANQIDPAQPLIELGVDSLMAVEVRNSVASSLNITLSPADVLNGATTVDLAGRALALVSIGASQTIAGSTISTPDPEVLATAHLLANLDDLSDEQVDALLGQLALEDQHDDALDLTLGRT